MAKFKINLFDFVIVFGKRMWVALIVCKIL